MPVLEFRQDKLVEFTRTDFSSLGIKERGDLQRLLREQIGAIAPDTLVLSEEFGEWSDSTRRIDLLALDKAANLVVIEIKRTEDGGHMELQAVRYAAMIARMTFDQAVAAFSNHLQKTGRMSEDARANILEFLDWDAADDSMFGLDVRIILVAAAFSKEITTSVLWLNERAGLDIRCVSVAPYVLDGRIILEVQQVIPLKEMSDYLIEVREKAEKAREDKALTKDFTRFDLQLGDKLRTRLAKRNVFLAICQFLCGRGVSPQAIAGLGPRPARRVIFELSGTLDAQKFRDSAAEQTRAAGSGSDFNPRLWFCDDGELIYANGNTYAFSNQWGGENWRDTVNRIIARYHEYQISLSEAS